MIINRNDTGLLNLTKGKQEQNSRPTFSPDRETILFIGHGYID